MLKDLKSPYKGAMNLPEFFQWADQNGLGTGDPNESTCPICGGPSYDVKAGKFDCPKCKKRILRMARKIIAKRPKLTLIKPRKIAW
jgi:hypothetical protein